MVNMGFEATKMTARDRAKVKGHELFERVSESETRSCESRC